MTVRQLVSALDQYPDDMLVSMDDGQGWYKYVSELVGPDINPGEDSGFICPTLMPGRTLDPRDI